MRSANRTLGWEQEVRAGRRFRFGRNWQAFRSRLSDERITSAKRALLDMLGVPDLEGRTFLDAGCGSGLSSLAARLSGAEVRSFDYDPDAVECTAELRKRFFPDDPNWRIEQGSVLDADYLEGLGQFDIAYCWGVLHHTGAMWEALGTLLARTAAGGKLFVSIYNDQGRASRRWRMIKRAYNRCPSVLNGLILLPCFLRLWGPTVLRDSLTGNPLRTWRRRFSERGMSPWYDVKDWVGGYPFEVAKPEQVLGFVQERGFLLSRMETCAGRGCNEFVFHKPQRDLAMPVPM